MMLFLLISCICWQFIDLQAMESGFPEGKYGVDQKFFNKFYQLLDKYRQDCKNLAEGAEQFSLLIKNGKFGELKEEINKSPVKDEFQDLMNQLDEIAQSSPETKKRFKETESPKFDAHVEHLKKRVRWVDSLTNINQTEACK